MHRLRLLREFLTLGTLGTVAAVVGIAGTAYSAYEAHNRGGSNPGSGGGPGAMSYVPGWQGGADQSWQAIMQQMAQYMGADNPALRNLLTNGLAEGESRIPWLTSRMDGMGESMAGLGSSFMAGRDRLDEAGGQVFETAMDPRGQLHDRTQQQITDASRASSSARGIGMSPESAGLENQAVSNFNIDWQNQQLQRQLSGLQGLTGAYDAGGRQGQAGVAADTAASSMWNSATRLPFDLSQLFAGGMSSGIYNPMNALTQNLGAYMGLGQSGSASAFGQNQTNLNNLTSGLTTLGQQPWLQNYFSGSGNTGTTYPTDPAGNLQFDP